MDAFQVPQKVNRHVLKALNTLSNGNSKKDSVTTSQILQEVKYQMRNLVPVQNIDMVIQKSLKNLSEVGLINRTGPGRYNIGQSNVLPQTPNGNNRNAANRNLFKPSGSRKRSISRLNPNSKRTEYDSEDSLSGDSYTRTRKRLRTNTKKLNYAGRSTDLPKARQHKLKNIALTSFLRKSAPVNTMAYTTDYTFDLQLEQPKVSVSEGTLSAVSTASTILELQPFAISETIAHVQQPIIGSESNLTSCPDLPQLQPLEITQMSLLENKQQPSNNNVIEIYNNLSSFDKDAATKSNSESNVPKGQQGQQPSREGSVHSNSSIKEKKSENGCLKPFEFNADV